MSERDKQFSGNGLIVWFNDGQLKHRFFSSQEEFVKERDRLIKVVPDRCLIALLINWDDHGVLRYIGQQIEGMKS